MYQIQRQISLLEFISPFGKLNPENRWVKIANLVPWQKYEPEYAAQFCEDNGSPAKPFRMALGTLIIKQRTGHSDEEVLQDIIENPYMQFLIGLTEFMEEAPFCSATITNFRKYISQDMIDRINEDMFRETDHKDDGDGGTISSGDNLPDVPQNKGELLLDATCAPSDITYPTDVNLLNEAREKLEGIIDTLHRHSCVEKKPRTYRQEARKKYLQFIKNRKPRKNVIRKAVGQQLRYVRRDLSHIDKQLTEVPLGTLSSRQQQQLETIRTLYTQQEEMYRTRTHSIENRIVSISQPWVRPIVRGKTKSDVEFGAKISISMVNGYAFKDKLDWNAYSEAGLLISVVETYKESYGFYPTAVIADKLYRNRDNLAYCKKHDIRLSGPRLGRPQKQFDKQQKLQERQDASTRNAIEGKFGEGKTKYGLNRIMARLQGTCETVISMVFLCMNIGRKLRFLFAFLMDFVTYHLKPVDNSAPVT
jgi:hypothetical protein